MSLPPLDRKLLRDLWRLKSQIFAICLVIACGISTYVAVLSVLDTLRATMNGYYADKRFADVFMDLERAPEHVKKRLAAVPGVATVETRVVAGVTLDVPGVKEVVVGRIVSVPDHGEPALNDLHLLRGRLPELGRPDEILVSEAFAEAHDLRPRDRLVAVINGRRRTLSIVGIALSPEFVYALKPGALVPDDRLYGILWMRRQALAHAFDMAGAFNSATAALSRGARPDQVLADCDRILEPYGGLGAILRRDQSSHWFLDNEFTQLSGMGATVPFLFLGVAAFLMNVVTSRLVAQQREQIAVLKAFGYSNAQVGAHFLKLVVVVVLLAGALGVAGGVWMGSGLIDVYAEYFRFPGLEYALGPRYLVQSLLVAVIAALLGTWRSIRKAVRLPPAEAMRPKAPSRYHPTLIERVAGGLHLGIITRMVLRNLARRPTKALLTVIGIATSAALLVVGNAFMDGMRHGIDTQFRVAERSDVVMTLREPRSISAVHDVASLPSVRRVEPFRTVPVRFRAGHRERRLSVTGLTGDSRLMRLVDEHQRIVPLPQAGLVLTNKLAEILRVEAGDTLVMDVLERKRQTIELPVVRVVHTFFGLEAFMTLDALNAALDDGPTMNGARVLIDFSRLDELYAWIKETPAVVGISLRSDLLRSFEDTAADSVRATSFFLVLFAVLIVWGVVYNNARIILAERHREMASMRVLGYRRSEVSALLLGELWLLALIAVPVGCLLGYGLTALSLEGLETELYSLPFVIQARTYGIASVTVIAAALVSGLIVRRRIDRFDMVEVLKSRG